MSDTDLEDDREYFNDNDCDNYDDDVPAEKKKKIFLTEEKKQELWGLENKVKPNMLDKNLPFCENGIYSVFKTYRINDADDTSIFMALFTALIATSWAFTTILFICRIHYIA